MCRERREGPPLWVAEDDDAVRDSLQMMLESIGREAKAFASADNFLAAYHQDMAGCIVLDIRMPGMNGMELQRTADRKPPQQ